MNNKKTAIALGAFDGLHKGHMAVIGAALSFKEEMTPAALLFDRHPRYYLTGEEPKKLLQDSERDEILLSCGLAIANMNFASIKDMSPKDFVTEILIKKLSAGAVCCGWNYRFGKGGEGNTALLCKLCEEQGIECRVCEPVYYENKAISSTLIRRLIEDGEVDTASGLLGRNFYFTSPVTHGCERGRLIGAPTINQYFDKNFILPRTGVYASNTFINGKKYPSVTNIGLRPTFENEDFRSESHIIGFEGDLYGENVTVELIKFIREEERFSSLEELKKRIALDIKASLENQYE